MDLKRMYKLNRFLMETELTDKQKKEMDVDDDNDIDADDLAKLRGEAEGDDEDELTTKQKRVMDVDNDEDIDADDLAKLRAEANKPVHAQDPRWGLVGESNDEYLHVVKDGGKYAVMHSTHDNPKAGGQHLIGNMSKKQAVEFATNKAKRMHIKLGNISESVDVKKVVAAISLLIDQLSNSMEHYESANEFASFISKETSGMMNAKALEHLFDLYWKLPPHSRDSWGPKEWSAWIEKNG